MGSGILTAVKIQTAAFWFITWYKLVDEYQRFGGTLTKVEALSSETLVIM
jgi:hypothetical protein